MDELFERLVHTFPGMAYRCLHDASWSLEFASDGATDLLGYSPAELVVDRVVVVSDLVHPDDLAKVSLAVEKGISASEPFRCVYRMRTRAGNYKWISEVGRGVFDSEGNLEAIEGFLTDITAEVEARESNRVAERREVVARLASGVAHDFNNILTGILGSIGLLRSNFERERPSAEKIRVELEAMEELVERASGLSRQLLQFGKPLPARGEPIDLPTSLRSLEALLRRVLGESIELSVRVPDFPAVCRLDPVQLEQVVINLAVNARDAMPNGGKLTMMLEVGGEQRAILKVSDTGEGMDEAQLNHMFEPYFTTKEKECGTGLGLATVSSIVSELRGNIAVRSAVGKGTTFEVELPLVVSEKPANSSEPFGTEVILLAEDEDVVRRVIAQTLRRLGYTVLEASNGEQAIKISERHKGPIDLLVTDGQMPKLNGVQLARALRTKRPSLHAILMTGDSMVGPPELFALEIRKPMPLADLALRVRSVLDRTTG